MAWPSLRGLAHDTGWSSLGAVQKARHWLVKNGAIERVEDYVRPAWRDLPLPARTRLVNLDRSEYYRVTGVLVVGDKALPMLYENPHQDDEISHVSSDRTSTARDVGRRDTELDLSSDLQLDTIKAVVVEPAATAAGIETTPERPNVFVVYEKNIGVISQIVGDQIKIAVDEFSENLVEDAIKEAALNNVHRWSYISAILERWKRDGKTPKKGKIAPAQVLPTEITDNLLEDQMVGPSYATRLINPGVAS